MGDTATSFGHWVRRRRLALDLTQVALARRVGCSQAAVKKIEHDERRPSRTMATRLAEALGIGPDQLQQFIAVGLGEAAADRMGPVASAAVPGPAPAWLLSPLGTQVRPVVGRDGQLSLLRGHLDATLSGRGRTVFVTGEAGQGKTALMTAFADVAQQHVPELVVVRGAGTTVGGFGEPYQAVRDVFRTLVADPRAPWHADQLTPGQAKNLWAFAPTVASSVLHTGPHLLDVLVPADTVSERLGGAAAPDGPYHASRDHVVAEVTDVLHALSAERPLLVLLDDMQWADTASAELVFHLTRRLADARVLLVCAYRGSEVAPEAGPAASALRMALQEARRDLDYVHVDLDNVGADTDRELCDAILDLEMPQLGADLRDAIYGRTRGHPLFIRELVRELRDRGDLFHREDGSWTARAGLNWDDVPARVAAVIEQRLDRIGSTERALLDAAAVEGEYFTVEVAAHLAGVDEQAARRVLTQQLDRRHGLVRETGTARIGARTLTRYRFGHALFRQFVYDTLSAGERVNLHGRLAGALEALYSDDADPVVAQLAHHYAEAGDAERAVPYLTRAGDRARLLHAHDEAITAYERVAGFLRAAGERERLARTLMKIGLTYQTGFDHERAQPAFDEAFTLWSSTDTVATGATGSATLRLVWGDPESLDPTMGGYSVAAPVVTNLLSGLVRYDEGTNVVPDVAHRWEITDNGLRYVFHLRDDVHWTDGRPVTAHDFVFTYRRALDPATGARVAPSLLDAVAGARDIRWGRAAPSTAGIAAPDDRTLVIDLAEPTSYFIYNLAYYVLLPVPQHVVEAYGADWWAQETIVSNGPFQLANWDQGRSMVLLRNPRYHGAARGNVDRVTLNVTDSDDEHEALYLADDVDLISSAWFTGVDATAKLRHRFPAEYVRRDRFVTFYYALDPASPPLDDRRVRQAMAMAVDRDSVVAHWTGGLSSPATGGMVPPGMPGHVPDLAVPYDPDGAARLVAESARTGEPPELTLMCRSRGEPLARRISESWRDVGIPCRLNVLDNPSDLFAAWETAGPAVLFGGWVADYPDPDTFLRVNVELDLPEWRHERYWSLIEQAARTADSAARLDKYGMAERILAEEAVMVPLCYEPEHLMLKPWVTDYPTIPAKYPGFWKDVTIGARL